jgi:hypothetical protein
MKSWKYWLVPVLFTIGGVGWLLKPLKQYLKGEPVEYGFLAFTVLMFTLAFMTFAAGRKTRLAADSPAK